MRTTFLPFSPPSIGNEERAEVMDTLLSNWITTGPKTKAFEAKLTTYLQAPSVVALNSCTAGLHVGLVALGIQPGDEVILPSMTFCATANVVEHVGARPILVDVQPDTLNIDPAAIARAITPRTKAIMPVHFAGHPVELDSVFQLADLHGLAVLEDAAHALSARYKGQLVGSRSNLAAFSFYATKNITTSEGGCLSGDPELVERARVIGHQGMSRDAWKRFDSSGSWYCEVVLPGFKYNMSDIQAALGLHQLDRLEGFQRRRREVVRAYERKLGHQSCIQLPTERPEALSSWHLYIIRLRLDQLRIDRNMFIDELKNRNIGAFVHYLPVHMQPYYHKKYGYQSMDCPIAADAFSRMITLPLHPGMTDQDIDDVVEAIEDIIRLHTV